MPTASATSQDGAPAVATPLWSDRAVETIIDNERFMARLTNRGAQLVSFKLKKHRDKNGEFVELVKARDPRRADFLFAIQTSSADTTDVVNRSLYVVNETHDEKKTTVEYRLGTPEAINVTKTFTFTDEYQFGFAVAMTGRRIPFRVVIGPGIRTTTPEEAENRYLATGNGIVQVGGKYKSFNRDDTGFRVFEQPDYIGIADNYFLAVLKPERGGDGILRMVEEPFESKQQRSVREELFAGVNAADGIVSGTAYFGPKEADLVDRYGLSATLQFGVFGFIARFLLVALVWVFQLTKNWGWAIIVLTIIIKILLYPLQHKSIVSMKKMQKVQPKMNAIKEKYKRAKTDPEQRQKMNTEMMKLYQVEGINPMAGCLPILLQLPILWAFYSLLANSIELRGADFLGWITDLSAKDPYYITPILMTITMFIQQWMTPMSGDPAQRKIFLAMPFIFGWIFKEFPSGLVLYWLVQNVLTILQQWIMNRYWKEHPEELEVKKAGA